MHLNNIIGGIASILGVALTLTTSIRADVTDNFTADNGGWTHVGDVDSTYLYHSTGGNPGGYLSIGDAAEGVGDFFVAPAKYLGNKAGAIGQTVSVDINLSNAADGPSSDLFFSNGSTSLTYVYPVLPTTPNVWLHEFATISPSDPNWHLNNSITGPAPTASDFQAVFSSLTLFEVLGDYRSGTETVGLDNVTLQTPEPATLAEMGLISLLAARRRT